VRNLKKKINLKIMAEKYDSEDIVSYGLFQSKTYTLGVFSLLLHFMSK